MRSSLWSLSLLLALPAAAEPEKELTLDLGEGVTMEFVLIPAGSFMMGSPENEEGRGADEGPQHEVTIAEPFYMGKFEVTNAQYRRFNPKHKSRVYKEYGAEHDLNGDDQPAVFVHWKMSEWFCDWLAEQIDGKYRVRVPSEAQWEYAARGGDDRLYPWGNEWPPPNGAGNFADAAIQRDIGKYWASVGDYDDKFAVTAPVGSFEPNPYGLYDMAGNAWEWCEDLWHKNYEGAPTDGSSWDPDYICERKRLRCVRGGAWHTFRREVLRTAYRGNIYFKYDAVRRLSQGYDHVGFRVVLVDPSEEKPESTP